MTKRNENRPPDAEAVTSVKRHDERYETAERRLSPAVTRLLGIVSDKDAMKQYRQYLVEKYGR